MSQASPATVDPGRIVLDDCWNKIGVQGDKSCPELKQQVHCRNCPVFSAAAVQLLDWELPPDYLDEWTSHFAKEKPTEGRDTHAVSIFRIGMEWLALPVSLFLAVSEVKPIHSLPHRQSRVVLGLVNIRGELLVCVSLEQALGIEKAPEDKLDKTKAIRPRLLVVGHEGRRLVFLVDEVHGIHRYRPEELKDVPATVGQAGATYTKKLLAWQGRSVGILDDQLLFYTLNRSLQ